MTLSTHSIPFHRPTLVGTEGDAIAAVLSQDHLAGDGPTSARCCRWLRERHDAAAALLTPSCTHALELVALLLDLQPGDEIIMPSYTFVSTANAFVVHGGTPVFVDIDPRTMNIDPERVTAAISARTRAIVAVHYGGVGCDMEALAAIATEHGLVLIEDAAQALGATRSGTPLGGFGDFACYSFHATKNVHCGEGGALLIRNSTWVERAEIAREKGTNRTRMVRGEIDRYTWLAKGSSYLLSEINAAVLWAQLQELDAVTQARCTLWSAYESRLDHLREAGHLTLAEVPTSCRHNAHLFFVKTANTAVRAELVQALAAAGIAAATHYVPLHSSPGGGRYGRFAGEDRYTTAHAERLLRLPLFTSLSLADVEAVCTAIEQYYRTEGLR